VIIPRKREVRRLHVLFLFPSASDTDDSQSDVEEGGATQEGPPPLASDDHCHVFISHSCTNADDQDQIEQMVQLLENRYVNCHSSYNNNSLLVTARQRPQELEIAAWAGLS